MHLKISFFTLLLFLIACKENSSGPPSPADKLKDEVMAIHDKVMPEMTTIHNLKKELQALRTPDSDSLILAKIKDLDDSDEAMMQWMHDFDVPKNEEEKKAYLLDQKSKISGISELMYRSIDQAKATIDSLQKK